MTAKPFSYHGAGIFSNGWLGVSVHDGHYMRKEADLSRFLVIVEKGIMLVGD